MYNSVVESKHMKNTLTVLSLSFLFLLSPLTVFAIGFPFGGRVVAVIPCTCNYAAGLPTDHIIYSAPFYLPLPLMIGSLDYNRLLSLPNAGQGGAGAPATFSFYNVDLPVGIHNIGDFLPVETCFMAIPSPPYCVPIAAFGVPLPLGLINRVGSSLVPNI